MALIPDPVTCFSTARYFQKQVFRIFPESNLVFVDWITSGRHESGEKWDFEFYKSTNHIVLEGDEPLFLDSVIFSLSCICDVVYLTKLITDYTCCIYWKLSVQLVPVGFYHTIPSFAIHTAE